jgi:hypothetical protein
VSRFKINPLVIVGVPTLSKAPLSWGWAENHWGMSFPLGASMSRLRVADAYVDMARNAIVEQAIQANADYVFFVGDDVHVPSNAFNQLWSHQADIVTGIYWTKEVPSFPYIWNGLLRGPYMDWVVGEYFPVDLAGCDCLLVKTDVFRAIEPPWFSRDWTFEADAGVPGLATEDFYFFTKARQAGFTCYADTMVQCYHEDRPTGAMFGLRPGMPQASPAHPPDDLPAEAILVADVGAGLASPEFGPKATVVRFDAREDVRPDVRCDVRAIPKNHFGRYDLVHTRHVLEHFGAAEAVPLVQHWAKLVKVGGELRICVPDIEQACRDIVQGEENGTMTDMYSWYQLYGAQQYDLDFHKNGFTRRALLNLLQRIPNFGGVTVEQVLEERNLVGHATRLRDDVPLALAPIWREIEEREAVS